MRQDKSGQALDIQESVSADSEAPDIMFICSMVNYSILTKAVRHIFISKFCLWVLIKQIADLCCEVKIENDILCLLLVCSRK